jgi:inorganic triphosphatase YgiF
MIERELNLHVPKAARTAIGKALRAKKAKKQVLHACYYDTPARTLAHARIALRLRLEGAQWVQTLKSPGADALSRIELNHLRPEPSLDLSVYEDDSVRAILSQCQSQLALRFETRVTRLTQIIESPDAMIEIAYDQGAICANGLELPISDIEFELISGDSGAMFDLGEQWLRQYGLILDLRSKAERGDLLAKLAQARHEPDHAALNRKAAAQEQAEHIAKPRRAAAPALTPDLSAAQAYVACANECLSQIIRNATFVAGVDSAQATEALKAEHLHQLRVGIRRLRTCWKLFNNWVAPVDPALSAALQKNFNLFGETRDLDVVKQTIAPKLIQANMPVCVLPSTAHSLTATRDGAASPALQSALLGLLKELVALGDVSNAQPDAPNRRKKNRSRDTATAKTPKASLLLKQALIKRLNRWLEKITIRGPHFAHLPIEEQHDLRKMVKRLRYSLDFSEGILASQDLEPWRNSLIQAQQLLGELNDFYTADHFYQTLAPSQPIAWFAVGWLRAMQHHHKAQAQTLFKHLTTLEPLKA